MIKRKKNFFTKKKIVAYIVCMICFTVMSTLYIREYRDYSVAGKYTKLSNWEQYIAGIENYKVSNNKYVASGEDPHIFFDFSSIGDSINGIRFTLNHKVNKAQIYYFAQDLPIDEGKSVICDESKYVQFVGESEWDYYRLDVDDDFQILNVEYISDATRIYDEKCNLWKYIVAFLINGFFSIGIVYLNPFNILFGELYRDVNVKRKLIFWLVETVIAILISWNMEKIIVYIFEQPYINPYRRLTIFVCSELFVIIAIFRKKFLEQLHLIVFIVIILLGGLNVYSSPVEVGISWDDEIHYARTLYISDGMIGKADLCETRLIDKYSQNIMNEDIYTKSDRNNSLMIGKNLSVYKDKKKLYTNKWHIYSISYIPAAMGIFVGKVMGLDFYQYFRMGKLFNVIIYSFIFAYAIKILKNKGKMLLTVIALIPTNIFLASNYAYDWWVTSLLALAFSKLYSLLGENKKISMLNYFKIIIIAFIAILPKAIYVVLFLPLLFIPSEKLEHKIKCKIIGTIGMMAGLCTFVLPMLINVSTGTPAGDMRGGYNVNSTEQLINIIYHPFKYIIVLFRFLLSYFSINDVPKYTTNMSYYGIGSFGIVVIVIVLLIAFIDNPRKLEGLNTLTIIYRSEVVICGLLTVMAVATALYLDFTAVGSNTILGCQNRYLIPVLFPTFYCLFYNKIEIKENIKLWIYRISILTLCIIYLYDLYELMIVRY